VPSFVPTFLPGASFERLQLLERAFHRIGRRVHVTLRHRDAAVPHNPHDGERVYPGLSEPRQYGVPQGVYDEVAG